MTIKQAFEKFIFAKRIQGLSDESISDYDTIVGLFVRYVGYDTDIEDITPDMIDSYMEYQLGRGIARSTFATYVRNAKIFLMWIETKYNLDLNASEIVTPRTPKTMPYIYSTEDIRLIFATIHFDEEWLVFRNRSMVALMLDSGLRQAEICNLKISDMDFHGDIVKVHGKGNKERLVPLGGHSKRYILTYLELCPYESNKLFLSVHGDSITTNALKLMATKLAKQLPFEFSCHKLRHNFATNYCLDQYDKSGQIDVYSLMALMGHENIKTTERYMHIAKSILSAKQHISHLDKIIV